MTGLHPSASAGDGKEIDQSTYIKKADKLDRMIECAQCGFIVDLDARAVGDSLGAIPDPTLKSESFTPPRGAATTQSYGDPVDSNSGCPFCNSMNPQGAGRDTDPFVRSAINFENL